MDGGGEASGDISRNMDCDPFAANFVGTMLTEIRKRARKTGAERKNVGFSR